MIIKKISPSLLKLIALLNDGNFHDECSLAEKLKMSEAEVAAIIKRLIAYHVLNRAEKSQSYYLTDPLDLLQETMLKSLINEKSILVDVFESLPSTQDYLKTLSGDKKIRLCIAEHQSKGRGRFNRYWHAPFGKNIYLSLFYRFSKNISELSGLSLVVGLSLCKTLNALPCLPQPILIKWPNDLLCEHKKIAGILIEMKAEPSGFLHTYIGVGINVNMLEDDNHIPDKPWTSLKKLTGKSHDRHALIAAFINQLLIDFRTFEAEGFEPFLNESKKYDLLYNKTIAVKIGDDEFTGLAQGLNSSGHLLLKLDHTEKLTAFSSGDTTIASTHF